MIKRQTGPDTFHLDPAYFPAVTKDLLTQDELLRYRVLPLGYKRSFSLFRSAKTLNVGFVDPISENVNAVEKIAREKMGRDFSGMRIFKITKDEFLQVLKTVYGIDSN